MVYLKDQFWEQFYFKYILTTSASNTNLNGNLMSLVENLALCFVKDSWAEIEQAINSDCEAIQWCFARNNMLFLHTSHSVCS